LQKVKVHWLDSIQDTSGWVDINEYDFDLHEKSMSMETIGYCIKSTDNSIFIAQSVGNDKVASVVSIPSGCIRSIIKIKE
jgi:hypothetical protein